MLKNRFIFAGAAAALIACAGGAAYFTGLLNGGAGDAAASEGAPDDEEGPPPAVVQVAEAVSATLTPSAEAPGSVVSLRDSLIAAATAGKIEWVAEIGAEVAQGDLIARIDPADAASTLAGAEAETRRLAARADWLERNYQRFVGLGEESGESEASLDQMRAERDEARQTLASAEAALERARINLERTQVQAPFAGRIVSQEIQIGEYASPGAAVARLVDTHHLEVTAQAQSALLDNVKPGDMIEITDGRRTVSARLRAVVPVGDEISRTVALRLALPEPVWHIGSAVRVALPTRAAQETVAAHRDALILRADRISVYVIEDDDTARRVDIELGAADGDLIEIIGEIEPGDRLVIRGGERLRDGQKVTVQLPATAGADAQGAFNL